MASIFSIFEDQIGKETTEHQMQMKKLFLKMSADALLDETAYQRLMLEVE